MGAEVVAKFASAFCLGLVLWLCESYTRGRCLCVCGGAKVLGACLAWGCPRDQSVALGMWSEVRLPLSSSLVLKRLTCAHLLFTK